MKKGERKEVHISDQTKVSLSVATLLLLVIFAMSSTKIAIEWKAGIEYQQETDRKEFEAKIKALLVKNESQDSDMEIINQKVNLLEASTIENRGDMIEIKADIKWIRIFMEEGRK